MPDESMRSSYAKPGSRIAVNICATMTASPGCRASVQYPEVMLEPVVAGVRPSAAELLVARFSTPFGNCLVASAAGAVCFLEFVAKDEQPALQRLQSVWPGTRLRRVAKPDLQLGPLLTRTETATSRLQLRGTPFQLQVWEALLGIPAGTRIAYGELARQVGAPGAARAIAGAVAANHLAVLVPCHRVVRADGDAGGYRWGRPLKLALLAAEQAAPHPTVMHNAATGGSGA